MSNLNSGDGLLLVDKPAGMTSHDVVFKVRKILKRKDIGHAGTLDPMATGLLVVLVGQATKLSDHVLQGAKTYQTRVLLGQETDTDDVTGEVVATGDWQKIHQDFATAKALELQGQLQLVVPRYSAIKVKGQKLYAKARQGEDFTPPSRPMHIYDLTVQNVSLPHMDVEFSCSKGTYVRSWIKALGENLGCGATMAELRRSHSYPYQIDQATCLEEIESTEDLNGLAGWIPLSETLPHWPSIPLEGLDEKLVMNGQIPRRLDRFLELEFGNRKEIQGLKMVSRRTGRLLALLGPKDFQAFKILRVFPDKH